jgi:hypothetical protein
MFLVLDSCPNSISSGTPNNKGFCVFLGTSNWMLCYYLRLSWDRFLPCRFYIQCNYTNFTCPCQLTGGKLSDRGSRQDTVLTGTLLTWISGIKTRGNIAGRVNRGPFCTTTGWNADALYPVQLRDFRCQPSKAQRSLYVPSGLTLNSSFCPHSVFMCFVWISEQTAIISLYSIN